MGEWAVYVCAALLMAVVGNLVRLTQSGWMIAGYNTMSGEEKDRWNLDALKRFISRLFFLEAILLLVFGLLQWLDVLGADVAASICWPVFVMTLIAGVLYVNTGKRFKSKSNQ